IVVFRFAAFWLLRYLGHCQRERQERQRQSVKPTVMLLVNRQGIFSEFSARVEQVRQRQGLGSSRGVAASSPIGDFLEGLFFQASRGKAAMIAQVTRTRDRDGTGMARIAKADCMNGNFFSAGRFRPRSPLLVLSRVVPVGKQDDVLISWGC